MGCERTSSPPEASPSKFKENGALGSFNATSFTCAGPALNGHRPRSSARVGNDSVQGKLPAGPSEMVMNDATSLTAGSVKECTEMRAVSLAPMAALPATSILTTNWNCLPAATIPLCEIFAVLSALSKVNGQRLPAVEMA